MRLNHTIVVDPRPVRRFRRWAPLLVLAAVAVAILTPGLLSGSHAELTPAAPERVAEWTVG